MAFYTQQKHPVRQKVKQIKFQSNKKNNKILHKHTSIKSIIGVSPGKQKPSQILECCCRKECKSVEMVIMQANLNDSDCVEQQS